MTHINNYEYVKKWRLLNRKKYLIPIKHTKQLFSYYIREKTHIYLYQNDLKTIRLYLFVIQIIILFIFQIFILFIFQIFILFIIKIVIEKIDLNISNYYI